MKIPTNKLSLLSAICLAVIMTGCSQTSSIKSGNVKNYETTIYESARSGDQTLFDEIGGKEVIASVMNDLVDLMSVNPKLDPFFRDAERNKFVKAMLTEQLCELAEGPCKYAGRSMTKIHASMQITDVHFIALVEDGQKAMRKNGLSFETENKILALLAPMKKVIVAK